MKKYLTLILIIFCVVESMAQKNVLLQEDVEFNEGIYLNITQFKENAPIEKARIVCNFAWDDPQFFEKLLEMKTINLFDNIGNKIEVSVSKIWGFCSNGDIYVNYNGYFNRIGIIGPICHFMGTKDVLVPNHYNMYGPFGYSPYYNTMHTSKENCQYMIDSKGEKILEYNAHNLEVILMNIPELHDQFMELSKKKREQKLFYYIRLYNSKMREKE